MTRYFNGKKVELLAPSGTMETFKSMVNANCYAIYFGGKSLNMRMMRKGYNFSDEETLEAVLIEANITSFKVEGRMRDTDFIVKLVNIYGDAMVIALEKTLEKVYLTIKER